MTILILAREENEKTANLRKVFGGFSHSVILDRNIQDETCIGLSEHPRKTAWDYAFDYVEENDIKGHVCFVEDDVAGPQYLFELLLERLSERTYDLAACNVKSQEESPGWCMWNRAEPYFVSPWRSFNPFCVLSEKLLRACFEFKRKWGHYTYLELLFAGVAKENEMDIVDLQHDEDYACFFPWFYCYPPIWKPLRGICHPVKDDTIHRLICFGR